MFAGFRKITKYTAALLLVVLVVQILAPVHTALAAPDQGWQDALLGALSPLSGIKSAFSSIDNAFKNSLKVFFADSANWLATHTTGLLSRLAAYMFSLAASWSLDGDIYGMRSGSVFEGFKIFRDLTNILFIFIVIYIGFRIILGLTGPGVSRLLVTVILVAILLNFSLVLVGLVIDASNILALAFYDAFPNSDCKAPSPGERRDLTCPVMEAGGLQAFLGDKQFKKWADTRSGEGAAFDVVAIFLVQAFLHIILAFIFGAGAILFLIRIVVLTLLSLLAPLGVAAFALPQTQGYGYTWLKKLLSNAFFAPIFLAVFYVASSLYLSPFMSNFSNVVSSDSYLAGAGFIVANFFLVAFLFMSALLIGKQLSVVGATTAVAKVQQYTRGTGRAAAYPVRRAGEAAKRYAKREGADIAARRLQPMLGRVPGFRGGLEKVRQLHEAEQKKASGRAAETTTAGLQNIAQGRVVSPEDRTQAAVQLAKRGELTLGGALNEKRIEQMIDQLERVGRKEDARALTRAEWQYADLSQASKRSANEIGKIIKHVRPSDMAEGGNFNEDRMKQLFGTDQGGNVNFSHDAGIEAALAQFTNEHMKKLEERADETTQMMTQLLEKQYRGKHHNEVLNDLSAKGNRSLQKWARSPAGKDWLATVGVVIPKDKEGSGDKKGKEQENPDAGKGYDDLMDDDTKRVVSQ